MPTSARPSMGNSWGWYNQFCGHEDHGYATEDLAETGAVAHMKTCNSRTESMTHPSALYVEFFRERPDDKGGWERLDE